MKSSQESTGKSIPPKVVKTHWVKNPFRRKQQFRIRKHSRHPCYFLGTLKIQNNSTYLDGLVTNISKSGLKFRPAKTYILDRRGEQVMCIFSNFRISGKIVTTNFDGYGVILHSEISDEDLLEFLTLQEQTDQSLYKSKA